MSNSSDNLIVYLKLDAIDNNQALDSSKLQNKGTVSGGVTVIPDDSFGNCFSFDGVDDCVKVDPAKFASVTNNFTISFWVIPTATIANDTEATTGTTGTGGQRYAIFPTHGTNSYGGEEAGAGISVGTNGVSVYEHAANYLPPLLVWQNNLSSSKWNHIAVVYTNKQPSLYVNGKLIKTGLTSSKNVHPSGTIGGKLYGNFPGKIANVRIYNKPLSPEEIKGDMDDDLRMSNTNKNLVLYLPLDEVRAESGQKKVIDASGKSNDVEIKGNPTIVLDEKFGSSLNFNGSTDYINITKPPLIDGNFFTIEAWIQPNKLNQRMGIISYGNLDTAKGAWFFVNDQGKVQFDLSNQAGPASQEVVNDGNWHHAAVVSKNGEIQIYVDGKPSGSPNTKDPQISNQEAVIGRGLTTYFSPFWFNGKIANVRIYNKPLSLEEIKRDMDEDLSAIAAFNKTHPLDFNLYEGEDKESVIFIENGTKGQELILEISNNTDQSITLPAKSGEVTQDNYQFELRFRPETLSPTSLQQLVLKIQTGWSMSSPVTQPDGTVSLYFLTTNSQALAANQTATLTLQNIIGAAEGGARTTRVELLCPEFTYQGETQTNYFREKSLSIINHRGKKNIPLHIGFIGSNRILNDGQQQTLILQIHNVLKDKPIDFNPKSSSNPSRLILYFDVDTDWGLGTKAQVENIIIEAQDWQPGGQTEKDWDIHKETEAVPTVPIEGISAPYWVLTHKNENEPRLTAGHTIQITLKIQSFSTLFGLTNLYLRYENIPGYWDGTFVCTIEKAGIIFDRNGNIGIGTSIPQAKLQVINTTNQDANGNTLILGPITQSNLRLGYHQNYSWIQSHGSKPLAINAIGNNVGIGITDPGIFKLNVDGGGTRLGGLLTVQKNAIPESENNYHLEVFSPNTNDFNKYTKIRFHQSNQYWGWLGYHGLAQNTRGEFVFWDLNQNKEAAVRLGELKVTEKIEIGATLTIGNITIGENELRILKALASGSLEVDLYNVKQDEFMYAADYAPFDDDRRRVFTWRRKGRINQGRWRLTYPG